MRSLSINIDHVATLRQARMTSYPEVIHAAGICEIAGADGITCHLREDRRHIQDRDVRLLKETLTLKLNLEMAATEEMQRIALNIKPKCICLVPEKRQELTTEGGLNIIEQKNYLKEYIKPFKDSGIDVSLFVDPDYNQIEAACEVESDCLEIHTGRYCDAVSEDEVEEELSRISSSCKLANREGFRVNAGHGIYYNNIIPLAKIRYIEEFSIGHGIISRAVFVGLERAVREMKELIHHCTYDE